MSIATIEKPADRTAWLQVRHGYANASDAAVYMGCHPFKTLADLVVEKLSDEPENKTSRAMDRGNRLEAVIAEWWSDDHGIEIHEPDVMYVNGRFLANPDRLIAGAPLEALEVKSTALRVSGVEDYWWWQAQAQMHCGGWERIHFAVLDASMDLSSYVVERDDAAIARLVAQVEQVWSFLDLGMVPEGVELGAEHVARMHPIPAPGSAVEVEGKAIELVQEWVAAKAALGEAEKVEKAARDAVCRMLGDAEAATVDGRTLLTWKAQARSSVDTKALFTDHPELVGQYERTTTFRVLRPTKELGR